MDVNASEPIYPALPPNGTLSYPTRVEPTYLAAGVSVAFVRGARGHKFGDNWRWVTGGSEPPLADLRCPTRREFL